MGYGDIFTILALEHTQARRLYNLSRKINTPYSTILIWITWSIFWNQREYNDAPTSQHGDLTLYCTLLHSLQIIVHFTLAPSQNSLTLFHWYINRTFWAWIYPILIRSGSLCWKYRYIDFDLSNPIDSATVFRKKMLWDHVLMCIFYTEYTYGHKVLNYTSAWWRHMQKGRSLQE